MIDLCLCVDEHRYQFNSSMKTWNENLESKGCFWTNLSYLKTVYRNVHTVSYLLYLITVLDQYFIKRFSSRYGYKNEINICCVWWSNSSIIQQFRGLFYDKLMQNMCKRNNLHSNCVQKYFYQRSIGIIIIETNKKRD